MNKRIINTDFVKECITNNSGNTLVSYRWSHGATDKHMGDGLIIYSIIQHIYMNKVYLRVIMIIIGVILVLLI